MKIRRWELVKTKLPPLTLTSWVKVTSSKGNQNPNMLRKLFRRWLDHFFFFCFARSRSFGGEPANSNIGTGQWESPAVHHQRIIYFLFVTIVKLLKSYFSPILVVLLMSSVAALKVVVMPIVPTCDMSGLWVLIIQYFYLGKLPTMVGAILKQN